VGTGRFSTEKVASAMNLALDSELISVMSQDSSKAEEFAAEHYAQVGYDTI
jgi:predicted dehydrogenase